MQPFLLRPETPHAARRAGTPRGGERRAYLVLALLLSFTGSSSAQLLKGVQPWN